MIHVYMYCVHLSMYECLHDYLGEGEGGMGSAKYGDITDVMIHI